MSEKKLTAYEIIKGLQAMASQIQDYSHWLLSKNDREELRDIAFSVDDYARCIAESLPPNGPSPISSEAIYDLEPEFDWRGKNE